MSKVCSNCGAPVSNDDVRCPYCGNDLPIENIPAIEEYDGNSWDKEMTSAEEEEENSPVFLKKLLALTIPIFGFVFYSKLKARLPETAKKYWRLAIIGIIVWIVIIIN